MKFFYAPASPFARKVHISLIELGMQEDVELLFTAVSPGKPNADYVKSQNPLGKVPSLQLDSGDTLFDSTVICDYLDSISPSIKLLPQEGVNRFYTFTHMALAQGICESAVTLRYETFLRPEEHRWPVWIDDQWSKIARALTWFESHESEWQGDVDLAQITLACALGYLDFRMPEYNWRQKYPALTQWFKLFSERDSFQQTVPSA